jgi:hypothetical protein
MVGKAEICRMTVDHKLPRPRIPCHPLPAQRVDNCHSVLRLWFSPRPSSPTHTEAGSAEFVFNAPRFMNGAAAFAAVCVALLIMIVANGMLKSLEITGFP